jgi:hypothetical protein
MIQNPCRLLRMTAGNKRMSRNGAHLRKSLLMPTVQARPSLQHTPHSCLVHGIILSLDVYVSFSLSRHQYRPRVLTPCPHLLSVSGIDGL